MTPDEDGEGTNTSADEAPPLSPSQQAQLSAIFAAVLRRMRRSSAKKGANDRSTGRQH
jgi:hypothetical protein